MYFVLTFINYHYRYQEAEQVRKIFQKELRPGKS